jgi:hypothetical protein
MSFPQAKVPEFPMTSVKRFYVAGVPGFSEPVVGTAYSFVANVTDVATIPILPWTVVYLGPFYSMPHGPRVWRMNAARQDLIVELESISDAGTKTILEEAQDVWDEMVAKIAKSAKWLRTIGAHQEVIDRATEFSRLRAIEVRTLQDDFLARVYAQSSADMVRTVASLRFDEECLESQEITEGVTLEKFLWPENPKLPKWAQDRYDRALVGNYRILDSLLPN